jgi:molybdopterin synthase sulfur carrier subunit
MVTVEFLGPISKDPLKVDMKNLNELKEILKDDDSLKEWLDSLAVAVNDEIVDSLDRELKEGDKISLLPPVCGG